MVETRLEKEKNMTGIYWRIESFNCKPNKNLLLRSPSFKTNWLKSMCHIEIKGKYGLLSAYLVKETHSATKNGSISVILLSNSGWITILENTPVHFGVGEVHAGVDQIISFQELNDRKWDYLPNGSLTVGFHLRTDGRMEDTSQILRTYKLVEDTSQTLRTDERMEDTSQILMTDELVEDTSQKLRTDELLEYTSQILIVSRLLHSDENYLYHRPIQTFSCLKAIDLLHFPVSYKFQKPKQFLTRGSQTSGNAGVHDSEELLKFFRQKEFTFVTLQTPNKEFVVHKAVLCAKSPVFNAMFERNMIESDSNLIRIDDIENETVSLLIKFLHFEPLGDLNWDEIAKLFYAADKYQIESLKKVCISLLEKVISTENVCDLYVLADRHQDKDLTSCVISYFKINSDSIIHSKKWQGFLRTNYELAIRIGIEIRS